MLSSSFERLQRRTRRQRRRCGEGAVSWNEKKREPAYFVNPKKTAIGLTPNQGSIQSTANRFLGTEATFQGFSHLCEASKKRLHSNKCRLTWRLQVFYLENVTSSSSPDRRPDYN